MVKLFVLCFGVVSLRGGSSNSYVAVSSCFREVEASSAPSSPVLLPEGKGFLSPDLSALVDPVFWIFLVDLGGRRWLIISSVRAVQRPSVCSVG